MSYLNLIVATTALIPSLILFIQYKQLKLGDLLLFSLIFLTASISMFSSFFALETDELVLYQIHNISWVLTYYLLLLHSFRIRWKDEPWQLRYINRIWVVFLILSILLWEKQIQPDRTNVLFFDMPHSHSSYFPMGAGLTISDVTIVSTGHAVLIYLYSLYSIIVFFYAYLTFKPFSKDRRILMIRRLWMVAISISAIFYTFGLPWFPRFDLLSIFLILGLVVIAYISLFIPEGMLISHAQILSARPLYNQIKAEQTVFRGFGTGTIIEYLENLPRDVFDQE